MPSPASGIGSMNTSAEKRKEFAKKSLDWTCKVCNSCNRTALPNIEEIKEEQAETVDDKSNCDENNTQNIIPEVNEEENENKNVNSLDEQPELRQRDINVDNVPIDEQPRLLPEQQIQINQPRPVQVSPLKVNLFLAILALLLLYLLVRRYF